MDLLIYTILSVVITAITCEISRKKEIKRLNELLREKRNENIRLAEKNVAIESNLNAVIKARELKVGDKVIFIKREGHIALGYKIEECIGVIESIFANGGLGIGYEGRCICCSADDVIDTEVE